MIWLDDFHIISSRKFSLLLSQNSRSKGKLVDVFWKDTKTTRKFHLGIVVLECNEVQIWQIYVAITSKKFLSQNENYILHIWFTYILDLVGGSFTGLAYQSKDIVFRFIVEGFWPLCSRSIFIWEFLKDDIFGLHWNLSFIIELWRNLNNFGFFEDYIFARWNIWISIILLLP